MVCEVRGQNQLPEVVDAFLEFRVVQSVENLTLAIVQDANCLRKMMPLVHTALAAVELGQGALRLHLVRVAGPAMVEIVTQTGDQEGETLQFPVDYFE